MFADMIKSAKMREQNDCRETSQCDLPRFEQICHIPSVDLTAIDGRRGREVSQWRNRVMCCTEVGANEVDE